MGILIFILVLFFLSYAVLILYYRAGWTHLPEFYLNKEYVPKTRVSIIVPARNEEDSIGALLKDLLAQYYPADLMEVIVVDDHSTDRTPEIVQSFAGVTCIDLSKHTGTEVLNSYKKKAIETAIRFSRGELIVTTDADCRMGPYWLLSLVSYFETGRYKLIAAPVHIRNTGSLFGAFQSLDFMTMQGITAAVAYTHSGTMCNGANLAYTRQAYDTVGGFVGIDHIASGDDMLLMYKIEQRFPKKTNYLKCHEAVVTTDPMPTPGTFFQQRIRWASKASHFKDRRITAVLVLVFLYNLSFVLLSVAALWKPSLWVVMLTGLVAKIVLELQLLRPVARFFRQEGELLRFPLLQLLHIPYIVVSGFLGQFGTYRWKERQVK